MTWTSKVKEILISVKTDFKINNIIRDKEGPYIMTNGTIKKEDITIINIYGPNIEAPEYIRKLLTNHNGKINSNIIIVTDFNTPLPPMDRSSIQKIKQNA